MSSSDYNNWLSIIKEARYMDESRARDILRRVYSEMVSRYGAGDSDVQHLYSLFHLHI